MFGRLIEILEHKIGEKSFKIYYEYWHYNLDNSINWHQKFVELCALMILILDLQVIQC